MSKVATHSRDPHTCHAWIEVSSGIDRPTEFRHTPAHPVQTRISPKNPHARMQESIQQDALSCAGSQTDGTAPTMGCHLCEVLASVGLFTLYVTFGSRLTVLPC
jgi:hypothetical protein